MKEEIDALERNGMWTLEDLPPGKKAIGSDWVYNIKHTSTGEVEQLKIRLVVYGNRQVISVDYNETFTPVAMGTVRLFLSVASSLNLELHQMNVHNVFLHVIWRRKYICNYLRVIIVLFHGKFVACVSLYIV